MFGSGAPWWQGAASSQVRAKPAASGVAPPTGGVAGALGAGAPGRRRGWGSFGDLCCPDYGFAGVPGQQDGNVHMFSNLSHAVPVLRELGVGVSASRLYNEYRDQVERAHGLPVTSRTVVIWPRVSVSKV